MQVLKEVAFNSSVMRCMLCQCQHATRSLTDSSIVLCTASVHAQPCEALKAYAALRSEGFAANSTTYNALLATYGALGKLDSVAQVRRFPWVRWT